jgi:SAM-dependent methyltransferase
MSLPGNLTFICNICGCICEVLVSKLSREDVSCHACNSTVRMRGMIYALSLTLFDKALTLPEFPENRNIIGKGMSDWEGYALPLSNKLSYTNTYYHKSPKLDITNISYDDENSLDFLLTSDVFEHVNPPVNIAFENARRMIKPGGSLVLSVPYVLEGETHEHFPNLNDFKIDIYDGEKILINRTKDGFVEKFNNLIFHGGEGETIEMRVFSESGLLKNLVNSGFKEIKILKEPFFEFGIYWPSLWSLPIIAK